jgi:hypothetical protein
MFSFSLVTVVGQLAYTLLLRYPLSNESQANRSGDLEHPYVLGKSSAECSSFSQYKLLPCLPGTSGLCHANTSQCGDLMLVTPTPLSSKE